MFNGLYKQTVKWSHKDYNAVLTVDEEKQLAAISLWPPMPHSTFSTPIYWFLLKTETNFYLIEWTACMVISSLLSHVVVVVY